MKIQAMKGRNIAFLILVIGGTGCSSDCAPTDDGGVIVDIVGASSCDSVSVAASDSGGQYAFDSWPPPNADGGIVCSFRGLAGHTGTFAVNVSLDGNIVQSRSVTLERVDACNLSGKSLEIDLNQP